MAGSTRTSRLRIIIALALLALLGLLLYLRSVSSDPPLETLLATGWQARYEVSPMDDEALAEYHLAAADGVREQCVACHGNRTDSELIVHGIHLRSELLPGLACQDCHAHVDLGPREADTTDRWVDVAFCRSCHSEFPGLDPDSEMDPHNQDSDCVECHVGEDAPIHDKTYLPSAIDPSECRGCHGGRALPWTPAHELDDWLDTHGPEALESGSEDCFACHDFGLKFCDECHAQRPPSHTPAERWSDLVHAREAQADTRVCYTCHDTSWCKECHVNHEEGWLESHPDFVGEKGDESCAECHSAGACSFCHTHGVGPDEVPD